MSAQMHGWYTEVAEQNRAGQTEGSGDAQAKDTPTRRHIQEIILETTLIENEALMHGKF